MTTTAHKDHRCTLCGKPIPKGEEYINQTIRPWDHSDNEGFSTFKAHVVCNTVWHKVGDRYDWVFPDDPYEWAKEMARHAGGDTP